MTQRNQIVMALILLLAGVGVGLLLRGIVWPTPSTQQLPHQSPQPADGGAKTPFTGRALVAAFFPESPCFIGGKLHYVDYTSHCVMTWDGQNATKLWCRDKTGPSAVIPLTDGTLLVACNSEDEGTLVRLDPSGKELLPPIKAPNGKAFNGPNDFAADGKGGVYFSVSGKWEKDGKPEGQVFYRSRAGVVTEVADGMYYSNGLAVIDGDGGKRLLLVAEGMRNQVLQFTIGENGMLSNRAVWRRLADMQPDAPGADWATGPDGLKVDSKKNVYICQFGAARILVADLKGNWLRTISVPLKGVTNLTFGPEEKTLIVTAVKDANEPYLGAVYEIPNR